LLQKRRLGQTDIEVSVIGLGTVKIGRNQAVKYPAAFSLPSNKEVADLLAIASTLGINLIDTAPAYGTSEERLGNLLQANRHDWVICTKVGEEFSNGESHFDFSERHIIQSIERSLKRLQTDYLDIVLVHSNGDDQMIIEQEKVFSSLEKFKTAGKIRAFGMSTKTVAGGLMTVASSDVAMVTYHPNYQDEREVIAKAYEKQKGIFIKKAFASGHLVKAQSIAATLEFILAEKGVTSVIIGTINPEHLRENVVVLEKALIA